MYYWLTDSVDNDLGKGIKFLTIAANSKYSAAKMDLIYCYIHNGQFNKAEHWTIKAMENGCKGEHGIDCSSGALLKRIRKMKKDSTPTPRR